MHMLTVLILPAYKWLPPFAADVKINKKDSADFRPISVTPILFKIDECTVVKKFSHPFFPVLAFHTPDIPPDPEDTSSLCPHSFVYRNMLINRCLFQYI